MGFQVNSSVCDVTVGTTLSKPQICPVLLLMIEATDLPGSTAYDLCNFDEILNLPDRSRTGVRTHNLDANKLSCQENNILMQ